eukprot:5366637-Pyramimonas_sp.AAC.1
MPASNAPPPPRSASPQSMTRYGGARIRGGLMGGEFREGVVQNHTKPLKPQNQRRRTRRRFQGTVGARTRSRLAGSGARCCGGAACPSRTACGLRAEGTAREPEHPAEPGA